MASKVGAEVKQIRHRDIRKAHSESEDEAEQSLPDCSVDSSRKSLGFNESISNWQVKGGP